MFSALTRKSVRDLTRRKARAFFTVLTLALAVGSVGILAVSPLMERAMDREVAANRLPDVTVSMPPLELSGEQLAQLEALPGVAGIEARATFATRVFVGERRDRALVVGVGDFAAQEADVVAIESGEAPGTGQVLTDRNNGRGNAFDGRAGTQARLLTADGSVRELGVSGVARNLTGADRVGGGFVTFYAGTSTVAELRGAPGYTSLALRLDEPGAAAAERAISDVRAALRATGDFTAFDDLPLIREPGNYPGKDDFEALASILVIITALALISALVLVSNTMATMVGEQAGEIAAMKAIGARRRDLRRLYLRTALLLGLLGALAGAVLGAVVANLVVGSFAESFFGTAAGSGVHGPVLALSIVVGLAAPPLAALPAVRRAAALPLAQALAASGAPMGGPGRLDPLLRSLRFLPRAAQIGLRNLSRRGRRSLSTALQVTFAVAMFLALVSVGAGVGRTTEEWFDANRYDIWIQSAENTAFGEGADPLVTGTEGVAGAQPFLRNDVDVEGRYAQAWGLPASPLTDPAIIAGRWYSEEEARDGAPVAVLAPTITRDTGARVGDELTVRTAGGEVTLTVIGLSANQASRSSTVGHNGTVVFLPLETLRSALASPEAVNGYWITTTSRDHGVIDATTTRLEDALAGRGEPVAAFVNYDMKAKQAASNTGITTAVTVLGLLIVAISMVALVNAVTMAVLERTREIGMLRSIGARARDIRRIFATEGLAVAGVGWLAGVPLGYAFARGIGWAAGEAVGAEITFVFPPSIVAISLPATLALAYLLMLAPLRRAAGYRPGEALRHV